MVVSCIISEIQRDIGQKITVFSYPLHLMPPLEGPHWNVATVFGAAKARVVWLLDGEKSLMIC